jgi:hypothetical protein
MMFTHVCELVNESRMEFFSLSSPSCREDASSEIKTSFFKELRPQPCLLSLNAPRDENRCAAAVWVMIIALEANKTAAGEGRKIIIRSFHGARLFCTQCTMKKA